MGTMVNYEKQAAKNGDCAGNHPSNNVGKIMNLNLIYQAKYFIHQM